MGRQDAQPQGMGGLLNCCRRRPIHHTAMTYQKIFELKFKKGFSTSQLFQRFPDEVSKVAEIALLQVPTSILRKMVSEEERLSRILSLKRKFRARLN